MFVLLWLKYIIQFVGTPAEVDSTDPPAVDAAMLIVYEKPEAAPVMSKDYDWSDAFEAGGKLFPTPAA